VTQEEDQASIDNTPEEPHTVIQFSYQSNTQMNSILKKTAAQCPEIATTYSIGRSVEGKDLLVIEFSNNPGVHELREYKWSSNIQYSERESSVQSSTGDSVSFLIVALDCKLLSWPGLP
jgi:hypothetical protein